MLEAAEWERKAEDLSQVVEGQDKELRQGRTKIVQLSQELELSQQQVVQLESELARSKEEIEDLQENLRISQRIQDLAREEVGLVGAKGYYELRTGVQHHQCQLSFILEGRPVGFSGQSFNIQQ